MNKTLSQVSLKGKGTSNMSKHSFKIIRLDTLTDSKPGPGTYDNQKQAIDKQVDEYIKKNEIMAEKVKINKKLRSKLGAIAK